MKKLVFCLLILIPVFSNAQSIEKDYVDEFTNNHIVQSSWIRLFADFKGSVDISILKIDSNYILSASVSMANSIFSIKENDYLYLKLINDTVLKLSPINFLISEKGGSNHDGGFIGSAVIGVTEHYLLGEKDLNLLKTVKLDKVRLYTSKGYLEKQIRAQKADEIIDIANLFD